MNSLSELNVNDPYLEAASRAFAMPERVSASWSEVIFLGKGWQASLDVEEERVVFWMYGSGPIILLMHGWSGRGSHLMGFVKPLITAGFAVALFDMPAHGHSSGTRASVIHGGRAALKLAEHLGGVHGLIAHCTGSLAALWALSNGLAVQRSVHIGGPVSMANVVLEAIRTHGLSPHQARQFCAWVELFMGGKLSSLDLATLSLGLKHEGLIIHDRDDRTVSVEQSRTLHGAWARSTLAQTLGLGHRRILRDPGVIGRAVGFMGTAHHTLEKRV